MDPAEQIDNFFDWIAANKFWLGLFLGFMLGLTTCSAVAITPDPAAPVPIDNSPRIFLKCGPGIYDLTAFPRDLLDATLRAAQRQMPPNEFLNFVHERWPNLRDGAAMMLAKCGAV